MRIPYLAPVALTLVSLAHAGTLTESKTLRIEGDYEVRALTAVATLEARNPLCGLPKPTEYVVVWYYDYDNKESPLAAETSEDGKTVRITGSFDTGGFCGYSFRETRVKLQATSTSTGVSREFVVYLTAPKREDASSVTRVPREGDVPPYTNICTFENSYISCETEGPIGWGGTTMGGAASFETVRDVETYTIQLR